MALKQERQQDQRPPWVKGCRVCRSVKLVAWGPEPRGRG